MSFAKLEAELHRNFRESAPAESSSDQRRNQRAQRRPNYTSRTIPAATRSTSDRVTATLPPPSESLIERQVAH